MAKDSGTDSPQHRYFNQEELLAIINLLSKANLLEAASFPGLLFGMNPDFKNQLPQDGPISTRALLVLDKLNLTGRLIDNELPIEIFLKNAVHSSRPRVVSQSLQQFLDRVSQPAEEELEGEQESLEETTTRVLSAYHKHVQAAWDARWSKVIRNESPDE